ncbi:MAG: 2'-5' RNA ligase family protein [Caldilineaceae bacterium]
MSDGNLITEYASNVSHWEKWQQEYRFGVLLIFPPEPLLTQVNTLRAQFDPQSQATCDAHISLTIPLPRPINDAQWRELESIAAASEPFAIQVGPLMNYLPHPGVCLSIAPQDSLNRLRIALESAFVFAGASVRHYPFSAHMTIAEFITIKQTEALMDELKDVAPVGRFVCNSVAHAVPDANFHFAARRQLALGHAIVQEGDKA